MEYIPAFPYTTHHQNVSDLDPCTNYSIDVFAVNVKAEFSDSVSVTSATADTCEYLKHNFNDILRPMD